MDFERFIEKLADRLSIPKTQADRILRLLFDPNIGIIPAELAAGGEVKIPGFGVFLTRQHPAHAGHNPQTGEPLVVSARRSPHVRFGQPMKDRIFR